MLGILKRVINIVLEKNRERKGWKRSNIYILIQGAEALLHIVDIYFLIL